MGISTPMSKKVAMPSDQGHIFEQLMKTQCSEGIKEADSTVASNDSNEVEHPTKSDPGKDSHIISA